MDKIIQFFKNADKLRAEVEFYLVNFVAGFVPWFAALIPAYFAFVHVHKILGVPWWLAFVFAAVIEVLGFASISTTLEFWNFRKRYAEGTVKGSVHWIVPVFSFSMYLIVIVLVNGILSFVDRVDITVLYNSIIAGDTAKIITDLTMPIAISASVFLLSFMTIPGAVIVASRTTQERFLKQKGLMGREKEINAAEGEIKATEVKPKPMSKRKLSAKKRKFLQMLSDDKNALKDIPAMAEKLGVTRQTIYNYRNELIELGYFQKTPNDIVYDIKLEI